MKKITLLLCIVFALTSLPSYASSASELPDQDYIDQLDAIYSPEEIAQMKSLTMLNKYFAVGPDGIYFINDEGTDWLPFREADTGSFEIISGRFAKDKNNIYNHYIIIEDADRDSFVVVSAEHGYSGDEDRIYGPHGVVEGADPDTFQMLNKNYAIDIANVYFEGQKIPDADAGSFEVLNDNYARDANRAYYLGRPIPDADAASFEVIGLHRAQDGSGKTFFQGQDETSNPDLGDLFDDLGDDTTSDESTDENTHDGSTDEQVTEKKDNFIVSFLKRLTKAPESIQPIHTFYVVFFSVLAAAVLGMLYLLFAGRMGEKMTPLRAAFNIIGAIILSALIYGLINTFVDFHGIYTPTVVFFVILALVLVIFGIGTFTGWIANLLVSLLVIVIAAIVVLAVFFLVGDIIDGGQLLDLLAQTTTFTDIMLFVLSSVVTTILYFITTKLGLVTSVFRSVISVLVALVILVLIQNMFGVTSMLWSVVIFHIFLGVMLFLIGMRTADTKLIYLAQVGRITFLHFVLMFVMFLILSIFLV